MRSLFPSAFDSTTKALNVSFNQRELSLFSNPTYELTYQFDNTTYDANIPLSLTHIPIDDIWTRVSIKIDDTTYEYDCRQDGRVYTNNNTYSIFWLFLGEENDLYFGNRIMEYNMIDPIGLLGAVNQTYILRLEDKIIYRNNNPQLIGGQMSYEARLYDYESGNFTAEYVIDVTSGIVFEINGNVRIVLDSPTNYPISRHRLVMCIVWIVMLSVVPLLTYYITKRKDTAYFLELGLLACGLEFYGDVWFNLILGWQGLFALHIGFALLIVLSSKVLRFPVESIYIILGELLFLIIMGAVLPSLLYTMFTFSIGSLLSMIMHLGLGNTTSEKENEWIYNCDI